MLLVRKLPRSVPRKPLRDFLAQLETSLARGREIVCVIADDRELRRLNRQFLGHDYPTDVLSFPSIEMSRDCPLSREGEGASPIGELAISSDRAAAQSAEHGHSLSAELRILMLHGALHLAGYDHEKDSGEMARAELHWRKRFALPIALIERAAS